MRRWALVFGVLGLVFFGLLIVRPFLAKERTYPAEVPSPPAVEQTSQVTLAPGSPVCWRDSVIEQHAQVVQMKAIVPDHKPGPPLELKMQGVGYKQDVHIPAGYVDSSVLSVPVQPPLKPLAINTCVVNRGNRPIALFASTDRTRSRSHAFVNGVDSNNSVWFSFFEAKPTTIPERMSATLHRMTIFRPGWVGYGLLRVLFWLFLVGVPIAVVVAFVKAVGEEERATTQVGIGRRGRLRRWLD